MRLRDFLSIAAFSSLLIFVSVVTRPFVSVMFAILAFVMMKSGVISFLGIDLNAAHGPYLAWGLGSGVPVRIQRAVGAGFRGSSRGNARRKRPAQSQTARIELPFVNIHPPLQGDNE